MKSTQSFICTIEAPIQPETVPEYVFTLAAPILHDAVWAWKKAQEEAGQDREAQPC